MLLLRACYSRASLDMSARWSGLVTPPEAATAELAAAISASSACCHCRARASEAARKRKEREVTTTSNSYLPCACLRA